MSCRRQYTCVVADDEELIRRRVAELALSAGIEVIGSAASGKEAVELIKALAPDIAFLDIRMPEMNGLKAMEALKELDKPPAAVLVTAYDEHAIAAFELAAVDYVLKPISQERFAQAAERAMETVDLRATSDGLDRLRQLIRDGRPEKLFVRDGARLVSISPASIIRVQAMDDYAEIHVLGRSFLVGVRLSALAETLPSPPFMRVHRSHLVNGDHVDVIRPETDGRRVDCLSDGSTVRVSRGRVKEVVKRFENQSQAQ